MFVLWFGVLFFFFKVKLDEQFFPLYSYEEASGFVNKDQVFSNSLLARLPAPRPLQSCSHFYSNKIHYIFKWSFFSHINL